MRVRIQEDDTIVK